MESVAEKPRVLVVDDEKIVCDLLSRVLTRKGYDVAVAHDGRDGIEKGTNGRFNVLITDLKMPNGDGVSVLREVKKHNPALDVLVVTGYPTINSAVEVLKTGASDFICKPFDIDEITRKVEQYLSRQRLSPDRRFDGELAELFEVARKASSDSRLESVLNEILASAMGMVGARRGSLLLFNEDRQQLEVKAAFGIDKEIADSIAVKPGEGICGSVFAEGKPAVVDDIGEVPQAKRTDRGGYKTRSFLSIPLCGKASSFRSGKVLGVLNITDKASGESFTDREKNLLFMLADELTVAIERSLLLEQLKEKESDFSDMIGELDWARNRLTQNETISSLGEAACRIAREIRDPLDAILSEMNSLEKRAAEGDEDAGASVNKIKQSVGRIHKLLEGLLLFTDAASTPAADSSRVVDEVSRMMSDEFFRKNERLYKDGEGRDILSEAGSTMLERTFLDFYVNAVEGAPRGNRDEDVNTSGGQQEVAAMKSGDIVQGKTGKETFLLSVARRLAQEITLLQTGIREDRVAEVKRKIANGEYKISGQSISGNILRDPGAR